MFSQQNNEPFQLSQHREQSWRKADTKKTKKNIKFSLKPVSEKTVRKAMNQMKKKKQNELSNCSQILVCTLEGRHESKKWLCIESFLTWFVYFISLIWRHIWLYAWFYLILCLILYRSSILVYHFFCSTWMTSCVHFEKREG